MKQNQQLLNSFWIKIATLIILFIDSLFHHVPKYYQEILKGTIFLVLILDIIIRKVKNGKQRKDNKEIVSMIVSFILLFIGKINDAILILILNQVVNHYQQKIKNSKKKGIPKVFVQNKNNWKQKEISKIKKQDLLCFYKNEKIPVDGILKSSTSKFAKKEGDKIKRFSTKAGEKVLAGVYVLDNKVEMYAVENYSDSITNKLTQMENHLENNEFASLLKKIKIVLIGLAIFLVFIPNIFTQEIQAYSIYLGAFLLLNTNFSFIKEIDTLERKKLFQKLAEQSIISNDLNVYQKLSKVKNMIFEKTSTLTVGELRITEINTEAEKQLLEILNYGEYPSTHPIAEAIRRYQKIEINPKKIKDFQEYPGRGIECQVGRQRILIGNLYLLKDNSIVVEPDDTVGTIIYVAVNKKYIGNIVLSDAIKQNTKSIIEQLKKKVSNLVILSGDNEKIVRVVAQEVGITDQYSNLTASEKKFWFKHIKEYHPGKSMIVGNDTTDSSFLEQADVKVIISKSRKIPSNNEIVIWNQKLEKMMELFKITKQYQVKKWKVGFLIGISKVVWIVWAIYQMPLWIMIALEGIFEIILLDTVNSKL